MALDPEELIRDALAVSPVGLTQTALFKLLRASAHRRGNKPTADNLKTLLASMDDVVHDHRYGLVDAERRARKLWQEGRLVQTLDAVLTVEPVRVGYGSYAPIHVCQLALRRALLTGDDDRIDELLADHRASYVLKEIFDWFCDPLDPDQLGALTPSGLSLVLDRLVGRVHLYSGPDLDTLWAFLEGQSPHPQTQIGIARVAFLRGDLDAAHTHLEAIPSDLARELRGALALFSGDVKGACTHYAASLSALRKEHGNDVVPTSVEGLFLPVAYLLRGTASRTKQAKTLIDRARSRGWAEPTQVHAGWEHLRSLEDPRHITRRTRNPIAMVHEALVCTWRGNQFDADLARGCATALRGIGLHLLAHEIEAGPEGRIAQQRAVRPAWQDALDQLSKALKVPDGGAPTHTPESRLAWTLHHTEREIWLEPRLQKSKRSGWSVGRRVALSRVHGCSDTDLPWTPADRRLASAIRKRTHGGGWGYPEVTLEWDRRATWTALVDHPAIFHPDGAPVRIVRHSPTLTVDRTDGHRRLNLSPPLQPRQIVVEQVGTGYEVTLLDPAQHAAAEVIGIGLTIPAAGAAAVDALLEATADLFRLTGEATQVLDGSAVVHAWLVPRGATVSVEIGVLPAGDDGPRLVPAQGSAVVLGTVDGHGARFRRDLGLEAAYLRAAHDLPGMEHADPRGTTTLDLETTLAFLVAARDQQVPVLWPEGGELRVRRSQSSAGVKLKSARGWFEASGDLALDDGASVDLSEVLTQLLRTRQRFLTLDDGSYLELEAGLRKSLDALARVAQPTRGAAIRVHRLASSALTSLLASPDVSASAAVRKHLAQLTEVPAPVDPPRSLRAELRPYQHEAFRWLCGLATLGAGAILADDMGLGKTVTALALMIHRAKTGPALVVAPTSVAGNWMREAERFAPGLSMHRLRNADDDLIDGLGPHDVVVCSYTLMVHRIETLAAAEWATVVFDESQALKNPATQRHKASLRLGAGFRLALTGTPIENHLGELHAQLAVVLPGLLGSGQSFQRRFAKPIEGGDAEVKRSLKTVLAPFLLRRTKQAVLEELPARTDTQLLIELSADESVIYEAQRQRALDELDDGASAMDVLGHLVRLRQTACSPALVVPGYTGDSAKTRAFRRLCLDLHASGHRALVFSQFVRHLSLLREVLDAEELPYTYLDGSTPAGERDARVKRFQTGDLSFFLISLKAGGVGLNLTAADYVLHMDPWWNPAVEDQASDRAHRIGQQRPVTVYRLIAKGTVEEQIVDLHRHKRDLAAQILDGSDQVRRLSAADLLDIVRDSGDHPSA